MLQTPGRHLVFVKYGPKHNLMLQWIANSADVDQSRIVWARSLNPEADRKAIEYWKGRSVWEVYADENPAGGNHTGANHYGPPGVESAPVLDVARFKTGGVMHSKDRDE